MKKTLMTMMMIAASCGAHAQWECPSRIGSAMKPVGDTGFSWSAELTASGGWIKDNYAANTMGFLGLNYTKGRNSFYVEGGLKAWIRGTNRDINYSDDAGTTVTTRADSRHNLLPGLREAFYKYSGDNNMITLGLQSARSDDPYLLNERIVGANYTYRSGIVKLNAIGGSVMTDFSRNGRFCTLGYLYNDIVVGRPRSFVGNDFGDTNFGMLTLSLSPEKNVDEFGGGTTGAFSLDKIGAVAYSEFGSQITNSLFSGGLYSEINIAGITLKPEVLYQASKNNNAVIYNMTADKLFNWNSAQTTRLYAQYVGFSAIDKGARPVNSFSNLFMGDVLRQDVLDAPIVMVGVKHSFTAIRTSIKLQAAMQTKASAMGGDYGFVPDYYTSPLTRMKEFDLSLSKNFGKSLLVNAMFGAINYPNLEVSNDILHYNNVQTLFGRLELRFTF